MGTQSLMNLATRRDRFVWNLAHRSTHDRSLAGRKRIECTLAVPPIADDNSQFVVLPGGRWVLTVIGSKIFCYDLQSEGLAAGNSFQPVLTIPLQNGEQTADPIHVRRFEFSRQDSTFNVVLEGRELVDATDSPAYWPQLIRIHANPKSGTLTYSIVPFPPLEHTQLYLHHLSGDFISLQDVGNFSPPQIYVWNWRTNSLSSPVPTWRAMLTSAGSLTQVMPQYPTRGDSVYKLKFRTWVQPKPTDGSEAPDSPVLKLQALHSISFELSEEQTNDLSTSPSMRFLAWAQSNDELLVFVSLYICQSRRNHFAVVINKHTNLPRLISSTSFPVYMRRKFHSSAAQAFFYSWSDKIHGWDCSIRHDLASWDSRDGPDKPLVVRFPFYPEEVFVIMKEKSAIMTGRFDHRIFCSRSGRLLLPLDGHPEDWVDGHRIAFRVLIIDALT
ncbi:hypothetical protein DL93DRAFT_2231497 [Clavulina sp. PMI_390]|nr:hypothetical protein DL93DRAFT_2231497 [Clavulina sp. PMI_390]